MSNEQPTDDELNRRAALLMGWTHLGFTEGCWWGLRPGDDPEADYHAMAPMPATEIGDALQFVAFARERHVCEDGEDRAYRDSASMMQRILRDGAEDDASLPRAITRACVEALAAAGADTCPRCAAPADNPHACPLTADSVATCTCCNECRYKCLITLPGAEEVEA